MGVGGTAVGNKVSAGVTEIGSGGVDVVAGAQATIKITRRISMII